ncbi:hypothetical protein LL974_06390 [Xanthomonas campestris pv. cannae]|nr:hypothetical protein [Xanthomonas campestris pv. cannae]
MRLLKAGDRPVALIARELGIPLNHLYKWATDLDAEGAGAFGGVAGPRPTRMNWQSCSARTSGCARERDQKKWRRTFRGSYREVFLDPRPAGLPGALALSCAQLLRVMRSSSGAARAGECPAIAADRAFARTNPRGVWQRAPVARVASAR